MKPSVRNAERTEAAEPGPFTSSLARCFTAWWWWPVPAGSWNPRPAVEGMVRGKPGGGKLSAGCHQSGFAGVNRVSVRLKTSLPAGSS